MKKVTIIGDIMVEPPFMQQVEKDGAYDFKPSFAPLKSVLAESDYVIGNLETPLAGEESGYTRELVSFNSPDVLVEVDDLTRLRIQYQSMPLNEDPQLLAAVEAMQ